MSEYSFCEVAQASGAKNWHVRRLTAQGKQLRGPCDTAALCFAHVTLDVNAEITRYALDNACRGCRELYRKETAR